MKYISTYSNVILYTGDLPPWSERAASLRNVSILSHQAWIPLPKHLVSILKRNNRNKRLVSESAENSFGSSFGIRYETSFGGHPTQKHHVV